jgi:hypothetical protein
VRSLDRTLIANVAAVEGRFGENINIEREGQGSAEPRLSRAIVTTPGGVARWPRSTE